MTRQQFEDQFGSAYREHMGSPLGQAIIGMLSANQPTYEFSQVPHIYADNRGAKRGYELCIRNMVGLAVPPKAVEQPKADYGVPETN